MTFWVFFFLLLCFKRSQIGFRVSFITTNLCPKTTLIIPINRSLASQTKVPSVCVSCSRMLQNTFTEQQQQKVVIGVFCHFSIA